MVSRSCVTITTVRPSSWCNERTSAQNASDRSGSKPAVGSSSSSRGGSMIRARAKATRLIMPPDRSAGILCAWAGSSPTICSLTMTASRTRSSGKALSSRKGNAMFSNTVKAEYKAPCWNNMPTRLAAPACVSSAAGRPCTVMLPRRGVSSPKIWRSNTVLPLPEPPTMDSSSPCAMFRFRSLWISVSTPPLRKPDHRSRISTIGGGEPLEGGGMGGGGARSAVIGCVICPRS